MAARRMLELKGIPYKRVDLAIESNGHEIDLRQRCATLRVEPGEIVYGDFYIENTWEVTEPASLSMTTSMVE